VTISLQDEAMGYLSGHVVDGRKLFPATGYLVSFVKLCHPRMDMLSF
jgi:hypothetical protein